MALAVASVTPSGGLASSVNHLISCPATVLAGEVLHAEISWPSAATVVDTDGMFTLYDYVVGALRLMAFAKIADGTEDGTTFNIQSSGAVVAEAAMYRIQGFTAALIDVTVSADATGNTDANGPSVSGPVVEEALYITAAALNNNEDVASFPAGYTAGADLVGAAHTLHSAYLIETSSSDDPGTFDYIDADAGDTWISKTVRYPTTGTVLDVVDVYPTADGTDTDVVDEGDATTDLFASIDDDPGSPSDGDWNNNTDDAGQAFYELTNMPTDFESANAVTILIRYRGQEFDGTGTVTLFARLYESDESTPLSDEVQVAQVTADSSFTNTAAVTLTGVVAADKATWDAARLRLRWART